MSAAVGVAAALAGGGVLILASVACVLCVAELRRRTRRAQVEERRTA